MSKNQTINFVCTECGYDSAKWYGKCPNCGAWDTIKEFKEKKLSNGGSIPHKTFSLPTEFQGPITIDEVLIALADRPEKRYFEFSADLLNSFFGGQGLVAGSFVLLAGEPGLGKSTFALQLLRSLYNQDRKLMYVTAEESVFELARRSERLGIPKQILLLQNNSWESIAETLILSQPQVLILDSVQTMFSNEITSSPGSIAQVSLIATKILTLAKSLNIAVILVGHVTKDGSIAGPKTLEHLVDSVLMIERAQNSGYRTLMFSKHRYGNTDRQLLLKMEEKGLEIITNPSLALLENLEVGVGVCYGLAMEHSLPFVVEVQALVSKPSFGEDGGGYGRREAINLKQNKLNTILAVAEKYLGLSLRSRDVYIQLTGLAKNLQDDSLDLPILLAVLSSIRETEIESLLSLKDYTKSKEITNKNSKVIKKAVFAGRLTLSGVLRPPTNEKERKSSASQLKFDFNPNIEMGEIRGKFGMK
jgi:DNA repair protein RadA/Sms